MKIAHTPKTAYTLTDIEKIGQQGDYEHQAQEFLRLTNSTLEVRFLRTGNYFDEIGPENQRDIYEFRLKRGTREYVGTFGASLQNTWQRYHDCVPTHEQLATPEHTWQRLHIDGYGASITGKNAAERAYEKASEALMTWDYSPVKPSAYNILACIQKHDVGTFDNFLSEFGYEINSKESYENAQRTYKAVQKEYHALQTLYSDTELQALATIV